MQTVTRPWPDIGPPFVPIPDHHVVFVDVKNVGPAPIVIWTLFMGVIEPRSRTKAYVTYERGGELVGFIPGRRTDLQ